MAGKKIRLLGYPNHQAVGEAVACAPSMLKVCFSMLLHEFPLSYADQCIAISVSLCLCNFIQ